MIGDGESDDRCGFRSKCIHEMGTGISAENPNGFGLIDDMGTPYADNLVREPVYVQSRPKTEHK
jgi:hypothetical protein